MNKKELFELYQKLYFHELEIKEKLSSRLQLAFAFHATVFTIIAYMLRMLDTTSDRLLLVHFFYFMTMAIITLIPSIIKTINVFWGNEYRGLPTAKKTEAFRIEIEDHEKTIKKHNANHSIKKRKPNYSAEEELQEYHYDHYANCSSHNTELNDRRSQKLHESFKWLMIAALPLLAACFIFIGFDLDASSPRKNLLIENKSLEHTIEKIIKANQKGERN